jgi:hypothetical protein
MSSALVDDADQEFASFQRIAELEAEAVQLRAALTIRQQLGQASGLLAARLQVPHDQAKSILLRLSQHMNVKVSTVARILNEEHCGVLTTEAATIFAQLDTLLDNPDLVERWRRI